MEKLEKSHLQGNRTREKTSEPLLININLPSMEIYYFDFWEEQETPVSETRDPVTCPCHTKRVVGGGKGNRLTEPEVELKGTFSQHRISWDAHSDQIQEPL
jgi:hypothetical protein